MSCVRVHDLIYLIIIQLDRTSTYIRRDKRDKRERTITYMEREDISKRERERENLNKIYQIRKKKTIYLTEKGIENV